MSPSPDFLFLGTSCLSGDFIGCAFRALTISAVKDLTWIHGAVAVSFIGAVLIWDLMQDRSRADDGLGLQASHSDRTHVVPGDAIGASVPTTVDPASKGMP